MLLTRQDMAGKALDDFDFSRPVSRANERAALEAVKEAVQLQISKYPTTEEEVSKAGPGAARAFRGGGNN